MEKLFKNVEKAGKNRQKYRKTVKNDKKTGNKPSKISKNRQK